MMTDNELLRKRAIIAVGDERRQKINQFLESAHGDVRLAVANAQENTSGLKGKRLVFDGMVCYLTQNFVYIWRAENYGLPGTQPDTEVTWIDVFQYVKTGYVVTQLQMI